MGYVRVVDLQKSVFAEVVGSRLMVSLKERKIGLPAPPQVIRSYGLMSPGRR